MQAAETVYEFGSSPDEDGDNHRDDGGSKQNQNQQQNQSSSSPSSSSTSNKNNNKKKSAATILSSSTTAQQASSYNQLVNSNNQPTLIAGTNLRPNKTSSTSINQKLNTSFSSISDSHHLHHHHNSPKPKNKNSLPHQHASSTGVINNVSPSEEQLLIDAEANMGGGGSGHGQSHGAGSMSNNSNTSLSCTTNSSQGNVSQIGNQSIGASSQKSLGNQQSSASSQQQNPNFDSNVISERVKNLATQIYQELKRIISRCNYDEDILSGLMPLIVRVLESLDLALIENQQLQVELELCKDDNDQLVIMFEKEKAAKRAIDKKLIESEYAYEEERQQYQLRIESLDGTLKMFELKAKNASDQATRFEEKEAERKREYKKLHDRYTELLKSHCDVVERVRHLVGNNEVADLGSINVPQQMLASSSDLTIGDLQALNKLKLKHEDVDFSDKATSLKATSKETVLKSWTADTELALEDASLVVIDDLVTESHNKTGDGSSHNESERAISEPEGEHEKESENDSIAYTSMEKEFRKLIQENKDLLNTKNALNVVKDDLIAEVDRLTNEVSMYEQAVEQLNATKDQMKQKVSTLDAELRKTKEELEKAKQKIRENNEEGVPYSQRKRFGRAEMAKVLMERNNYKERFMELQDSVRYTELIRANKMETEKRSGLWKFFSNLFGAPMPPQRAILGSPRNSSPVISYQNSPTVQAAASSSANADQRIGLTGSGSTSGGQLMASDALQSSSLARASTGSISSTNQRLTSNSDLIVLMDSDLNVDRSRASRDNSTYVGGAGGMDRWNSDSSSYIHAYGWSLRASSVKATDVSQSASLKFPFILGGTSSHVTGDAYSQTGDLNVSFGTNNKLAGLQIPIPQYCRPLTGDSLGMKIWCATAIDQSGGDLMKIKQFEEDDSLGSSMRVVDDNRSTGQQFNDSRIGDPDSSGSMVNISTSTPIKATNQQALRQLEQEVDLALNESQIHQDDSTSMRRPILKTTTEMVLNALPYAEEIEELSTCVWICSAQHSRSKITIIDIKHKPNELLDSFYVPTFLYCIKSIPGCKMSDLLGIPPPSSLESTDQDSTAETSSLTNINRPTSKGSITLNMLNELISTQRKEFYRLVKANTRVGIQSRARPDSMVAEQHDESKSATNLDKTTVGTEQAATDKKTQDRNDDDAEISRILDNNVSVGIATLQKLNDFVAHTQPAHQQHQQQRQLEDEGEVQPSTSSSTATAQKDEDLGDQDVVYYQPISTHLPTVWMGGKDSVLYIHSAIGQWKDCVSCVELRDSILQICHYRGRVFVALADGTLCVFFRNCDSKEWEFSRYLEVDINLLAQATCDVTVDLHDHDSTTSEQPPTCDLHSRLTTSKSAQADLNVQGESSTATAQQQPSSINNNSKSRPTKRTKVAGIHCLEIANKNLWLGYKNRIFIFDPITMKLKHTFNVVPQMDSQIRQLVSMKDGVFICLRTDLTLRLYSSLKPYQHIQNIDIEPVVTRLISPKTFVISHITSMRVVENTLWIGIAHGIILTIPCKLVPQISEAPMRNNITGEFEEASTHLSIARFVPKCDTTNAQISFHGHRDAVKFFVHAHDLMLSGGQGYLDFRLDMDDQSKAISDKSHLILWQLPTQ